MAERRDIDASSPRALRRVGAGGSTPGRHGHAGGRRAIHASLVRRCAAIGVRLVEAGAIVPFTPWTCATCGRRDDLIVSGSAAFCRSCLEASMPEDADDVYRDTGGGD